MKATLTLTVIVLILAACDDELICNEAGDACWHECAPVPPAPVSDDPGADRIPSDPPSVPVEDPCSPGGCCTFVDNQGWNCFPVASKDDCFADFAYRACDPGTCMPDGCNAGHGAEDFQDKCCTS